MEAPVSEKLAYKLKPHPLCPPLLKRRGGFIIEEGLTPLLNTPIIKLTRVRRVKERLRLSYISVPPSPYQGEGG